TVALAYDAGRGEGASFRVFANHVAPDVDGFQFGMTKRCHGSGVAVRAADLLGAYARARATGGHEPFALPHADDTCDDPGDVFGGIQIRSSGAPEERGAMVAARVALTPGPSEDCLQRTVLEEYDDDVELLGPDGRTLGGVGVPRAATLDLAGHAM